MKYIWLILVLSIFVAVEMFGDYNPGGDPPVSLPLFPFGYGLSYTTFTYSNLKITKPKIKTDEETTVAVDVTNTGKARGDEVAQMYLRDEVSSVTRPVKELKDFARVSIEPGEMRTVTFTITPQKLAFYNREVKLSVELETFQIMVGGNSVDLINAEFEIVE